MSRVTARFSMSLDGYVADANDGVDEVFKWYSSGNADGEYTIGDDTFAMSSEGAEFIEAAGKGAGSSSRRDGPSTSRRPGAAGIRWMCRLSS